MESFLQLAVLPPLSTSISSSCGSVLPMSTITQSQSLTALSVPYHLDLYTHIEIERENQELKSANQQFLRIINRLKNQIKDWILKYHLLETKHNEQQNAQSNLIQQLTNRDQEIKQLKLQIQNLLNDRVPKIPRRNRAKTHGLGNDIKTKIRMFESAAAQNKAIKTKYRKNSNSSVESTYSGGSEYSGTSTVSALSIMGYHGLRSRTPFIPIDMKPSHSNPLPDHIGTYDYAASDCVSDAGSISSDQIRTWHADGRKKRKCKGGKSHRTDFRVNRDKTVESIRRQQNGENNIAIHSVNVKQIKKVFTSKNGGDDTEFRGHKRKNKKKYRSFYKKI